MTKPHDTTREDANFSPAKQGSDSLLYHARIERYEDEPDLCTIYLARDPETMQTSWISAEAGSYCALEDAR